MDGIDLNSPEELLRAFEAEMNGSPAADTASAKGAEDARVDEGSPDNGDGKKETQPVEKEKTEVSEEEAEGIASKNGKHVIPYSVLKSERERVARAEQVARDMQAELDKLQAQLKSNQGAKEGESARTNPQQTDANELSDEELVLLKEDNPTVYRALMAIKAQSAAIESKLNPVFDRVAVEEENLKRTEEEAIQEAVDSVPKLAYIAATDQAAYELAQQFDTALKYSKAWIGKPLAERFEAVIDMVEKATGPINLPTSPKASLNTEEIAKAARAKAAEQAKETRSAVPTSLSEFPAGLAPAVDEQEVLENISPVELGKRLSRMTPEQLDAYLSQ